MVQLLFLIQARTLFVIRRWDTVPAALAQLADSLGWHEPFFTANGPTSGPDVARHAYFVLHYMMLRCLWEGRIGNDAVVKSLLKRVYLSVDEALDENRFAAFKADGGMIDLGTHGLRVQSTTTNMTFLLTFLVTVTSRREYVGSDTGSKSLVHARAMMEFADVVKIEDMWDTGCELV